MLFGEASKTSGKYRVYIDGELVRDTSPGAKTPPVEVFDPGDFAKKIGGHGHHVQMIATGLDTAKEHTLEIEPLIEVGQELRFESICVAGDGAMVKAVAARNASSK